MSTELFTIGHSTHPTEHFVELLKKHGITALCDVRSQPYSQYNPQYNRNEIAGEIKKHGIKYVFLGNELGARSDNPDCYENGKVLFPKLLAEPLFQQGMERLMQGVRKYSIALMCAEKDPITCHRTILVTRQLRMKLSIKHILEDGRIESNDEAEARLMNILKIRPDFTRNESRCIEEAYDLQGQKIAYQRKKS